MRTTLKRGIGRVAVVNGDGRAVLPPGALSPVTTYRWPERKRGLLRTVGTILFLLVAVCLAVGPRARGRHVPVGAREPQQDDAGRSLQGGCRGARGADAQAAECRARDRLRPPPRGRSRAVPLGHGHAPPHRPDERHDLDALVPARPHRRRSTARTAGRGTDRINAAYAYCGPQGSLETVRQLTGLPIHFLIGVNFDGFRESVDKLGGVWLDIDRRYLNPQGGDYATINLWPGYQRLKGWQALDFVRYRHTDSDLFRLGRQQQFVKAMKQVVRHKFKDPRNVFEVVNAMTKNMQIGRAGGRGISPSTLHKYARFAYEMPAGNFFQVKIGGLTGTNELTTATSNIETAIAEFVHPDVEALPRRPRTRCCPAGARRRSPHRARRTCSLVVLNGNGQPGAAANTSYLLAQKGYRVIQPPEGFQANAPGRWSRTFRTQIFYQGKAKAKLAADAVSALFNSSDIRPLPRNEELRILANGAMITVVVGVGFNGQAHADAGRPDAAEAAAVREVRRSRRCCRRFGRPRRGSSASRSRSRP